MRPLEIKNFIYALADPRTDAIRYIGQSSRGMTRVKEHLYPSHRRIGASFHSTRWLNTLLQENLVPTTLILEEVHCLDDLDTVECFWIALGRTLEWPLTNLTSGGGGTRGHVVSEETRAKISVANTGRAVSAEARANMSAAQTGRVLSLETRLKISARKTGEVRSPETREKMRQANLGKTLSSATIEKIRQAKTGTTANLETRAKMSTARKGRKRAPFTLEARANMSVVRKGKTASAETRAKMSEAHRLQHARRRATKEAALLQQAPQPPILPS